MKVRVRLDTATDIANFVLIANTVSSGVYLTDNEGLKVDGKSFLGVVHAREFKNLWCECEEDIFTKLTPYIITEEVEENT